MFFVEWVDNILLASFSLAWHVLALTLLEPSQACKDLESSNVERDKGKTDFETLQLEHTALKERHEADTAKLTATNNKLQQALKERGLRRKVCAMCHWVSSISSYSLSTV